MAKIYDSLDVKLILPPKSPFADTDPKIEQ